MGTSTAGYTLIEMAKNISPDGRQMNIAETMVKEMALLLDIPWFASNDIWAHKSLRQGKIGSPTWRGMNQYITPSTVLTSDQMDVIGIVEDFAGYDKLWIDRQPDPRRARWGRSRMYIEGMAQAIVSAFLYNNNKTAPEKPHGMMPRLNSTGRYVISQGGSATLASILVVTWGEGKIYGVYPKTGQAPEGDFLVKVTDLGTKTDIISSDISTATNTKKLVIYEDNFRFEGGLVVEDNRGLGRVCNINSATASAQAFEDNLIKLIDKMKITDKTVIYMNETLISAARIRQKDKANVHWTPGKGTGIFGAPVMMFDEIPIRKIDSAILLNTESQVS